MPFLHSHFHFPFPPHHNLSRNVAMFTILFFIFLCRVRLQQQSFWVEWKWQKFAEDGRKEDLILRMSISVSLGEFYSETFVRIVNWVWWWWWDSLVLKKTPRMKGRRPWLCDVYVFLMWATLWNFIRISDFKVKFFALSLSYDEVAVDVAIRQRTEWLKMLLTLWITLMVAMAMDWGILFAFSLFWGLYEMENEMKII